MGFPFIGCRNYAADCKFLRVLPVGVVCGSDTSTRRKLTNFIQVSTLDNNILHLVTVWLLPVVRDKMRSNRIWKVCLIGFLVLILTIGISYPRVHADRILQNAPRFDGANIYFTGNNGEASRFDRTDAGLSHFAGLLSDLGANLFTLEWRTDFPTDADLLVIAGPVTDFAPDQIARLWVYMNHQGRVLLLTNPIGESKTTAFPSKNGLFNLMESDMGLTALDDVAAMEGTQPIYATSTPGATDEATEAPNVTETEPPIIGERPILITNFTTDQFDKTDPITQALDGPLAFFTARPLQVKPPTQGFIVTPLVFTSKTFYGESNYAQYLKDGTFSITAGADTAQSELPVIASYLNDRTSVRMVVIGDREFATNGGGLRSSPPSSSAYVYPTNAHFLLNVVAWLLDKETITVDFPSPAPTATVTITPSPTQTFTPSPSPTSTVEATKKS